MLKEKLRQIYDVLIGSNRGTRILIVTVCSDGADDHAGGDGVVGLFVHEDEAAGGAVLGVGVEEDGAAGAEADAADAVELELLQRGDVHFEERVGDDGADIDKLLPDGMMAGMSLTLDREAWLGLIEKIAEALPAGCQPVRLCLVGSAACLLEAMPGRASRDLDVWQPGSDFDRLELKRAVEAAGLVFDPRTELLPDKPYVQIITPVPTQAGEFEPVLWARLGRLHLYLPPWPNLIASKLARGDQRDVEDVLFLASRHGVTSESVQACAEAMPEPARQQVLENLVYLRILKP